MTTPAKRKGDRYELELARQIADLTGWRVRRKLGAGRADDTGDLDGLPDCCAQVKAYTDVTRAIREGLDDLYLQHIHAGCTHAVLFVRRSGGRWIAVQTLEQWATTHREATAP